MIIADLKPGWGVLDIGGYNGNYAHKYGLAVGPDGQVVSVEPDPKSVQTIRDNNYHLRQVEVVQAACFSRSGKCALYLDKNTRACNSLWAKNVVTPSEDEPLTVEMLTLDELASRVRNLRAIKIDAQGAECHILQGGIETLMRSNLIWQVEVWRQGLLNAGSSVDELCRVFREHGWFPRGKTWGETIAASHAKGSKTPHSSIDMVLVKECG
jgi:FkbM family methyltransferase